MKKDAEVLKIAKSPYKCMAEAIFGLRFFGLSEAGSDEKDAEALKIVTSPYKRTAEAIFGGRKSG